MMSPRPWLLPLFGGRDRHGEEESTTPCILVQNQNAMRDRFEQVPGVLFGLDLGADTLMRRRGASFQAFRPG